MAAETNPLSQAWPHIGGPKCLRALARSRAAWARVPVMRGCGPPCRRFRAPCIFVDRSSALLPRPSKAIDGRGGGVAEEEEGGARVKLESTGCSAEPEACLISSCMNCGTGSGGAERARSSGTPYKELPTAARAARRAAGRAAAGRAAAGRAAAGRERRRGEWGASWMNWMQRMGHGGIDLRRRGAGPGAGAPSRRSEIYLAN